METTEKIHPWVAERRERITFGLELSPPLGEPLRAIARRIEELGFDALYVGDHPAWEHDCWMRLTVLAAATERLRIGPLVACAAYRLPVVTARLAADIDRLSGGRLVLGLGIGWDASMWGLGPNEFARLGLPYLPPRERQDALVEAISIIRGVWGTEPFSFRGRHFEAADVQVSPRPLQEPGPPLVVAGAGTRTLDHVARLADACNFGGGPTGGVYTAEEAGRRLDALRRRCEVIGRPYEQILPTHFTTWLILAEDEDAVQAKVAHYFPDGIPEMWRKLIITCIPEEAIAYYQGFADAGMRHFVIQSLAPGDDETIRLLAERVAPTVVVRMNSESLWTRNYLR